jgi:mycothione reductase
MQEFDLIVIGAGSGNGIIGRDMSDWKVALVEKDKVGGTCLNRGCIPSKMLIYSGEVAQTIRESETFGIRSSFDGVDWERITSRVWDRIDPIAESGMNYRKSLDNVTVYQTEARFVGDKTLEVDGEQIHAPKIVLAAGSRPNIPPIPGLSDVTYHTSDTVMRLPKQPKSMIIVGGGYIGAEMGHFFGSIGTDVTIIDRGGALLKAEDDDVSQRFTEIYSRKYSVLLNTAIKSARQNGGEVILDLNVGGRQSSVSAEVLLIAAGRIPNADILDVAKTGVAVDELGRVVTNDYFETNVPGIWALGDMIGPYQLKHTANCEAKIVAHNVVHTDNPTVGDFRAVPHAVFASPQVASVGLTERDAKAQGIPYVAGSRGYDQTAYGWAIEDTESFAKVVAHRETRELLGAHIIGPHASMLIQPLINAIRFDQTVDQLARDTFYIHPALTEVVEQALLEV